MQHPYQVMPPLSVEKYAALTADIQANRVQIPIDVDEEDNTLDGFHRRQICEELGIACPKRVLTGLTKAHKLAHALGLNLLRRHLSKAQKREIAPTLRAEGWTQERIRQTLDVQQRTVSRWLEQSSHSAKLPQADIIQGKDGKSYPSTKTPRRARRQAEGMASAEPTSLSPLPSDDSISADGGAGLARGRQQQDEVPASDMKPERSVAGDAGIESEAADLPYAQSPANSTTSAAAGEPAAAPIRTLPAAWVDDAEEQS